MREESLRPRRRAFTVQAIKRLTCKSWKITNGPGFHLIRVHGAREKETESALQLILRRWRSSRSSLRKQELVPKFLSCKGSRQFERLGPQNDSFYHFKSSGGPLQDGGYFVVMRRLGMGSRVFFCARRPFYTGRMFQFRDLTESDIQWLFSRYPEVVGDPEERREALMKRLSDYRCSGTLSEIGRAHV